MPSQASTFYSSLPGRVTRHITGLYCAHVFACTHHSTLQHLLFRCWAFVIFQFSDGRTAKCAAASRHHMVASLLLHGYRALSTTPPPTVTSWCELFVVCAATGLHTGVQGHCVLRLRVQPTGTTQCHLLTSSGGPHSDCHRLRSLRPPRSSHLLSSQSAATSQLFLLRARSPAPPYF